MVYASMILFFHEYVNNNRELYRNNTSIHGYLPLLIYPTTGVNQGVTSELFLSLTGKNEQGSCSISGMHATRNQYSVKL
jgi:hypothetical protein